MDTNKIKQQSELASQLGDLLLEEFKSLLTDRREQCSATDRATILRFLMANGWTVDPSKIPEELKGLLTSEVKFDDSDELPIRMVK